MKKVSELTGEELDYWVAKAEGMDAHIVVDGGFRPSRRWHDGGPIIEREQISLKKGGAGHPWAASKTSDRAFVFYGYGDTPLIAAMRAYVASKYDQEVEE